LITQSATAGGTSGTTIAAIITAAAAVLGVIVTQAVTLWRARSDRAYERRRTALTDAQDAALELRSVLRRYGVELRAAGQALAVSANGQVSLAVPDDLDDALYRARGALQVRVSRIDDARIVNLVQAWRVAAEQAFLSFDDVSATEEESAWRAVNTAIGDALSSRAGTPKRAGGEFAGQ